MAEANEMDKYEYSSEKDEDDIGPEIIFDASVEDMSKLDTFLQMYKPSVVKRSDGIEMVTIRGPKYYDHIQRIPLIEILEDWKAMQKNCQVITPNAIFEMAKKHNYLRGEWIIFKEMGIKIDRAWAAIARAVALGQCGRAASLRAIDDIGGLHLDRNVICVYNNDFTDLESVEKLEQDIRKVGIKCTITYKPLVYSYLGLFRNNEWAIKPTIYTSEFDLVSGKSKIFATFDKEVHHNPKVGQFNYGKQNPAVSWRDGPTRYNE